MTLRTAPGPTGTEWFVMDGDDILCTCATEAKANRIVGMAEALEWYGEQARLCRFIHSEGDNGRAALAADGGYRARRALKGSG